MPCPLICSHDGQRQRCQRCRRPLVVCYCHQLQELVNRWPVHILQHPDESTHALGTARIAWLGLANCELDSPEERVDLSGGDTVLIYPGSESRPVDKLSGDAPRRLLFLDASWRKSRRMLHEDPQLASLPRYHLESIRHSRYRIRKAPASGFLSTLEAIVMTLEVVEGVPGRYQSLLRVMDWMIDQQIARMGEAVYRRNYVGRDGNGF